MQFASIPQSANHTADFIPLPKARTHHCFSALGFSALALVLVLGIVAFAPRAQGQDLSVLYSFRSGPGGYEPSGSLVRDDAGNLYGTTYYGGNNSACLDGCGTIFKLDTNGAYTVLHEFGAPPDGANPQAGLIRDAAGNLYGTTNSGGAAGHGTVFKLEPTGKETVLHSFAGVPDGAFPVASLVMDAKGNLYGTTIFGGNGTACSGAGCGTVFKVDGSNHEKVLHSFSGGVDGALPQGALILDAAGNLYGTAPSGGTHAAGLVFKLASTGKETILYSFAGGTTDGSTPFAGLVANGGKFYGTTGNGGAFGFGTVFELDQTTGKERVLYSFMGGTDGRDPATSLVLDEAGNIYGSTLEGGGGGGASPGQGVVFKLELSGAERVLHHFKGDAAGSSPNGVILDPSGNLYATAGIGGVDFLGTVFEITQ